MPIPEHELQRAFVVVGGGTTVGELRQRVTAVGERVDYAVIERDGGFAVAHVSELAAAVARLGPAALALRLEQLPGVAGSTASVQRTEIGFGEAARIRDQQRPRRLLVLEGSAPIGLLTNESRGSSAGGTPFDLFGRYQVQSDDALRRRLEQEQPERICPHCGESFQFYELQVEKRAFACPHCHTVIE